VRGQVAGEGAVRAKLDQVPEHGQAVRLGQGGQGGEGGGRFHCSRIMEINDIGVTEKSSVGYRFG
jgi:hypothetical protein